MFRLKNWNIVGAASTIAMVLVALYSIYSMSDIPNMYIPFYSKINICIDIFGMLVCIIVFVTTLFDRRMNMATVYFMAMITLTDLLLFWDFEAWYVNNNPLFAQYNKMVNYYVYGFLLLVMLAYWAYLRELITDRDKILECLNWIFISIFVAGMMVILSNPWTGLVFDVNPYTGVYSRSDYFFSSFIAPTSMLVLNLVVTTRYIKGGRKKMALYSYSFLPAIAGFLQVAFFGVNLLYIAIVFSIVLIYGNFYVERGQEIIRKQAEIREKNITMMIAQIQPRFLFTSLRAIANIEDIPKETHDAIMDFGKYMRGNMDTLTQIDSIPFEKEMEHVNTYVKLEKLRFKEKLTIKYELGPMDFPIPALTLQMLVENAIKHGITIKEEGGTVIIRTVETSDEYRIVVEDDGVGFDTTLPPKDDSRSHVGLANVHQRLKELVDGKLDITSQIGIGTTAIVSIPKKQYMK